MSSAASLNASSTIINGGGLYTNQDVLSSITFYQSNPPIATFANAYSNAGIAGNVTSNVISELNNVGSLITRGHFLLDLYPDNQTPACSAGITPWTANTVIPVGSLISYIGKVYTTTGNVFSSSFDGNVLANSTLSGFSTLIKRQAQLPFSAGAQGTPASIAGFATSFTTAYSYANQVYDTLGSIDILKNKTYSQSGMGYKNLKDLVTGGFGTSSKLLSKVIKNWGTMYDIANINLIADPYVFGQNLINQGLGTYGNLSEDLAATGLDTTDITKIPASKTTTVQEESVLSTTYFVGSVDLPVITNSTTETIVTGNSPAVILSIYSGITGTALASIVNATGFVSTQSELKTLADYLNLTKIVSADLLAQLATIGIRNLADLGKYLKVKLTDKEFASWADLAVFLDKIDVPELKYLTANSASDTVLLTSTISTITASTGSGTGPFKNPTMLDYFGAVAGLPYVDNFNTINSNYSTLSSAINLSAVVDALDKSVIDYGTAYSAFEADFNSNVPVGLTEPSITMITSNVDAVNSALSSLPESASALACDNAVDTMLTKLSTEVASLSKAGVTFGSGSLNFLAGFSQSAGNYGGTDRSGLETDTVFKRLITADINGDLIRAAISENNNASSLGPQTGFGFNDPNPRLAYYQSQAQNIPLSTYLSQNK